MIEAAAPIFDEREVTDSGGHRTRRVFLRTTVRLAGVEREIEINLTDRARHAVPDAARPHRVGAVRSRSIRHALPCMATAAQLASSA